jgi:hypothetical protein
VLTWGDGWSGGLVDRGVLVVGAFFWAVGTVIVRHGGAPLPVASPLRCSWAPAPRRCWWRA